MLGETKVFRCVQNCVIVRDGSRTESGNEFHSDGPETEKLLCPSVVVRDRGTAKSPRAADRR